MKCDGPCWVLHGETRIPFDNRLRFDTRADARSAPEQYRVRCQCAQPSRNQARRACRLVRKLSEDGVLHVVLGGGVRDEVQHPNSSPGEESRHAVLPPNLWVAAWNESPGVSIATVAYRQS